MTLETVFSLALRPVVIALNRRCPSAVRERHRRLWRL
jgi:hypothetical protein